MTTLTTTKQESFGWTDRKCENSTHLDKNNLTLQQDQSCNQLFSVEQIQALSDKVKLWGYQLVYDDSSACRWCIADIGILFDF